MPHDPTTCRYCRERTDRKATYPPGPWHDEPDRVDLHSHGLPCFLNRSHSGAWCGYVGVPPWHPWHGLDSNELPDSPSVHGGLNYSSPCAGCLCHAPAPGEPDDVWWFGFDCAHSFDMVPGYPGLFRSLPGYPAPVYRDLAFARAETESLAAQLADITTAVQ